MNHETKIQDSDKPSVVVKLAKTLFGGKKEKVPSIIKFNQFTDGSSVRSTVKTINALSDVRSNLFGDDVVEFKSRDPDENYSTNYEKSLDNGVVVTETRWGNVYGIGVQTTFVTPSGKEITLQKGSERDQGDYARVGLKTPGSDDTFGVEMRVDDFRHKDEANFDNHIASQSALSVVDKNIAIIMRETQAIDGILDR